MKLHYKRTGPYTVSKVINHNTYKLDIPYRIWIDNVSHVSLPDGYMPPTAGQRPSEPRLTVVDDCDCWEVDQIFDSKWCYRKLHYLLQWVGYSNLQTSSEAVENLGNTQVLVDDIHREYLRKPRRWLDCRSGIGHFGGFIVLTFFWISAQYKWHRHGFLPILETSQVEVEFPHAPNQPWGCSYGTDRWWDILSRVEE